MFRLYLYVLLSFFVLFAKVHGIQVRDCECGQVTTITNRIVGGWETTPNQYPWIATILNHGYLYCSGAIINDRYILTAGHCVRWALKKNLLVAVGQHNIEKDNKFFIPIEEIILHEDFISHKYYDENDIALIKLAHPIAFGIYAWSICLPIPDEKSYYNRNAIIAGWGKLGEALECSLTLQESRVKVLSPQSCLATSMGQYVTDTAFCAYTPNSDACQGDSGSPLFLEREPYKYVQIGIVSWGIGCASNLPGMYTNVTRYLDWIYRNTQEGIYCTNE